MPRIATLAVLSVLSCSLLAAYQSNNKAAVSLFQSRYDGLLKATAKKNIAATSSFISPDYTAGDSSNPLTKPMYLDAIKRSNGSFQTKSMKVVSVIVNGKKATTVVDTVAEFSVTDKQGKHTVVIKARCFDTWIQNAPGWQLRHSWVAHKSEIKDGKPIPPRLGG